MACGRSHRGGLDTLLGCVRRRLHKQEGLVRGGCGGNRLEGGWRTSLMRQATGSAAARIFCPCSASCAARWSSETPSATSTAYRKRKVSCGAKASSSLKNGAGQTAAKSSERTNHSGGWRGLSVSSTKTRLDPRSTSSCLPEKPIQAAR